MIESTKATGTTTETATLAAGCFWCAQKDFQTLDGVIKVTSGYAGGKEKDPTYEQVSSGNTSHVESIQIEFNPSIICFSQILSFFWKNVDPFDTKGQFCDKGNQYKSIIFYHSDQQRKIAEKSKEHIEKIFDKPVATRITPFTTFYPAEEYHQNYHSKNPIRYTYYRLSCGRDGRLRDIEAEKTSKIAAHTKG